MAAHRGARRRRAVAVVAAVVVATVAGTTAAVRGRSATPPRRAAPRVAVDVADLAVRRTRTIPPVPLPDVQHAIWHAGRPGREVVVVDPRSGRVLSSRVIEPPTAPSRERGRAVALTFDDGPHPRWTPLLLQILRDEGVQATFCVVGTMARRRPDLVRAIADGGHELCNHTEHHVFRLGERPQAAIAAELRSTTDVIRAATGRSPRFLRAPGGHVTPALVAEARRQGMRLLGWTVDSDDHVATSPPDLLLRTVLQVTPGSVVLLHDGGGDRTATISMVQRFIHSLRFFGYRVVPLP